tara:strand:+ start:867 stop:1505 length:639 start_codon:yes stop_codon:yes gene_type:complete
MYSNLAVCILFFIISNTIFCQDYSNLVINEIMVSNDSIITDEYGEFDDWIEIYNKGDQIINLEGLHLSDSYADLDKYTFPSIFLEPDSYVIVWADDGFSKGQGDMHADFRLASTGEELFFADQNLNIIDQVNWGQMEADIAFARVPNGIGDFVVQEHTFSANNSPQSNNIENSKLNKKLIMVIDIFGRNKYNKEGLFIEIFDDGSMIKKMNL